MINIAAVIPTFNRKDYLKNILNDLYSQEQSNYILEIIIVVDGSNDGTLEMLETQYPKVNIIQGNGNWWYTRCINEGIKLNPDYFLIMNNDTVIDEDAVTSLVNSCNRYNDNAIVTGKVNHYDEKNRLQDVGYNFKGKCLDFDRIGLNEIDSAQYDEETERDMIDDVYWLYPKALYDKIGGYSNYFGFNAEQADLALRAKKVGYKLIYNPDAKLWHKGSVSIGGRDYNPNQAYWTIQSSLIQRYIHLNKMRFFQFYLKTINSLIYTFIKSLYFGNIR